MKKTHCIGLLAALLVLGIFSVALVVSFNHSLAPKVIVWSLTALSVVAGATVTYKTPVSGATAPTAAQVYGLGVVTAQVNLADADLTVDVTHNFGLDANELASLFPAVIINPTAGATVFPQFTIAKAANKITLNKASVTNTGGTFDVIILRPHTNQIGVNR